MLRHASEMNSVCSSWKLRPSTTSGSETALRVSQNWFSQSATTQGYSHHPSSSLRVA